MAAEVMKAVIADENLALPTPLIPRPRMQLMYDACTWKKRYGCTRLMLRVADVLANFNSTRYFRDVIFYVGRDKHGDLEANLAVGGEHSISSVLKRVATTRKIDGNQW
eukprot:1589069-Pleurochrysis_carterae.AAC.1